MNTEKIRYLTMRIDTLMNLDKTNKNTVLNCTRLIRLELNKSKRKNNEKIYTRKNNDAKRK